MSRKLTIFVIIGMTLLSLAASALAYPRLPEPMPSHWNEQGEVDGYSSRAMGALLLPLTMLGLGFMLLFLPVLDPLKMNVELFRPVYHVFIVAFCVFFTYLHGLSLAAGLGWQFNMNTMLIPAIGLLTFLMGFMVERAKQNWFIGIRTPWTLSSVTVWDKTHRTGGWMFKSAGLLALSGIFFPEIAFWLMFLPIMLVGLGSIVISYIYFKQEKKA